jgi:hypothetical protein
VVDGDEPSWSVTIEVDKDSCLDVGKPSSLCLFAADIDGSVLCLRAMYSLGSKTVCSLGCCAVSVRC